MLLIVCVFAFIGRSHAQCFTFSNQLAEYDNETYDGTYIYTSAEISGGVSMNISPSCAPYLPTFYHTPEAYNQISGSDGSSVGGWGNGAQTCEDCYLEYVNRQQWVAHVGVTYTDSMRVVAVCTGGGQFFGTSIEPYFLSIGSTYGELDGLSEDPKDGDPIGEYIKECSGGLPAVCPPFQPYGIEFGKGQYPWQYAHTYSLEIWKQNGSNPPTLTGCVMDPTSTQASGPGPCN